MNTANIRLDLGLSQEEFADKYNIPLSTVKEWDQKDNMPLYIYTIFEEMENLIGKVEKLEDTISQRDEEYNLLCYDCRTKLGR